MKKDTLIKLLGNELKRTNTGHYSYSEKRHAEEILFFLKELNCINVGETNENRIEAILKYSNSNIDDFLQQRAEILMNNDIPTKVLIPKCKLYDCEFDFYDGDKLMVIGENEKDKK